MLLAGFSWGVAGTPDHGSWNCGDPDGCPSACGHPTGNQSHWGPCVLKILETPEDASATAPRDMVLPL
ncbi:unnamed protein product [Caretta caretta]